MNILLGILVVLAYFGFGLGWSFFRWNRFVNSELDYYQRERQQFLRAHRIPGNEIPDYLIFEWRNKVRTDERLRNIPPNTQGFRSVIAFDVLFWWLSMVIDVVVFISTSVMSSIVSRYRKMTEVKLERVRRDFKE